MAKLIYALADVMARPVSFMMIFLGALVAAGTGWALELSDAYWTVVNLGISYLTMIIGQAVLVAGRRDSLATDLKLDRLIEASSSENDVIGAEKKDAEEIETQKKQVEERSAE